jgi:hypothetical protein
MGCRSVPKKVSEFLVKCSGRKYCDACIQERLGFKWRQQVQLVTATLAVTPLFQREMGLCCTCNETKQVNYAKCDLQVDVSQFVAHQPSSAAAGASRSIRLKLAGASD